MYLRICFEAAPIHVERITRSGCCCDDSGFASDPWGWVYHVDGASWLKFGKGDLMVDESAGRMAAALSPISSGCYDLAGVCC